MPRPDELYDVADEAERNLVAAQYLLKHLGGETKPEQRQAIAMEASARVSLAMGLLVLEQFREWVDTLPGPKRMVNVPTGDRL